MKIVINTNFGGFGLSLGALYLLIKLDSKGIERIPENSFWSGGASGLKPFALDKDYSIVGSEVGLFKNGIVYIWDSTNRTDHDLVDVVESMGEKANGEFARLKVVKIPDGTAYEIDDYDGVESIHEIHRSWH